MPSHFPIRQRPINVLLTCGRHHLSRSLQLTPLATQRLTMVLCALRKNYAPLQVYLSANFGCYGRCVRDAIVFCLDGRWTLMFVT